MTGGGGVPRIRTPDQRLRIFVSSTLRELQPERQAARAAIERLRLAPVMFELGARPHPPRELYRAYLEQSDVFVGLYWQQYGWVAPGEEASGLEDEYRLAPREMPKLIYMKEPAEREERLAGLIDRIRGDDTASYKTFSSADELAGLLEADLATLLAERFDASRAATSSAAPGAPGTSGAPGASGAPGTPLDDAGPTGRVPAPFTEAVGRERDVETLLAWLDEGSRRVVTLVGPGGVGKSRLAIEVARRTEDRFDRVTFVLLEHVHDPADVLSAIARGLGVRDTGDRPVSEALGIARAGRRDLIVLDNFEHLLAAAPGVTALLTDLPDATFLVTSRSRLRVRGEHVFDVEPLGLPPDPVQASVEEILAAPSVQLFRDRATAADPRFDVTDDNAADVARICLALEGVPLAIELAAACIRALTPATMLAKLDRMLPLLVNAARDVPERQRTIQATVEWSIDLLEPGPRDLFVRLGVFAGDFSLDAVEAVTGPSWPEDVLGTLLVLVDSSLLRQHGDAGVPLFSMLGPVREIATARFALDADAAAVRRAHADYYVRLALETAPLLRGPTQLAALARLEAERDNLRAGYRHLLEIGDVDPVADAVWRLLLYWWIRSFLPEAKAWTEAVLSAGRPLSTRTRAIALAFPSWVSLWQTDAEVLTEPLEEAVALFRSLGDVASESLTLTVLSLAYMSVDPPDLDIAEEHQRRAIELEAEHGGSSFEALYRGALGRILLQRGDLQGAMALFEESLAGAVRAEDMFVESIALTQVGWAQLALGRDADAAFLRNLELAVRLRNDNGIAFALEGVSASAARRGDLERSGALLGAADALRARTGLSDQRSYVTFQPFVDAVLASDGAAVFEAARARGRRMPRRAVLEMALGADLAAASTA